MEKLVLKSNIRYNILLYSVLALAICYTLISYECYWVSVLVLIIFLGVIIYDYSKSIAITFTKINISIKMKKWSGEKTFDIKDINKCEIHFAAARGQNNVCVFIKQDEEVHSYNINFIKSDILLNGFKWLNSIGILLYIDDAKYAELILGIPKSRLSEKNDFLTTWYHKF